MANDDLRGWDFLQAVLALRRESDESVRYRVTREAIFPEVEVEGTDEDGALEVAFLALAGMTGPLPASYAELVEERRRAGDEGPDAYLQGFENRLVELFLETHLYSRYWAAHAWQDATGEGAATGFEEALFALLGLGDPALRTRFGLPPQTLLYYAGLLCQRPVSATALEGILADHFQTRVVVEPFTGAWIEIEPEACCKLGSPEGKLSERFALGQRIHDPSRAFRVTLGPLTIQELQTLLPGASGAEALTRFVNVAVGGDTLFDYELVLRSEERPEPRLTLADHGEQRLGLTLWLDSGEREHDRVSGPFHASEAVAHERSEEGGGGAR